MKSNRIRDYAIYISIGFAIVGLVLWHAVSGGPDLPESAKKWIGLAFTTPILFGYAAKEYRREWRKTRFWGLVLALLILHIALFAIILTHVNHWGLLGFVFAFPIEQVGIGAALLKAGYRTNNNHL